MITGHHLHTADGQDIGEITDVIGGEELDTPPRWLAVKTGMFSERLVPYDIVVESDDGDLVTAASKTEVKHAPKVPVHIEPAGEDLEELRRYYSLT